MSPALSVVIPTRDRRILVRKAIEYFERRDPCIDAELIIVDNGKWPLSPEDVRGHRYVRGDVKWTAVGALLNAGIEVAKANVILRQDDDDWYAPDWYALSYKACVESKAGMSSSNKFYAYDLFRRWAWQWLSWSMEPPGVHWCGGVLTFRKEIWEHNKFSPTTVFGDDSEFVMRQYAIDPTPVAIVPDEENKHVMIRHGRNITGAFTLGPCTWPIPIIQKIMGKKDFDWYEDVAELVVERPVPFVRPKTARKIEGKPIGFFKVR